MQLNLAKLVENGSLRVREPDRHRADSLLESARRTAEVAASIAITERSATVVFREYYEAIRQLGEASWRQKGYEPLNHEITLDILPEWRVAPEPLIQQLQRYRKIRNDANYRGIGATVEQAKQISSFWKVYGARLIKAIEENARLR